MRESGIAGVTRRRRRGLTRQAGRPVFAPDLLERDFTAPRPGLRMVDDMTCLPTAEGSRYLATAMTCPPARWSGGRPPPCRTAGGRAADGDRTWRPGKTQLGVAVPAGRVGHGGHTRFGHDLVAELAGTTTRAPHVP
ncbi:hypothetical protein GCM10018966_006800 [Streptomyces yanii]